MKIEKKMLIIASFRSQMTKYQSQKDHPSMNDREGCKINEKPISGFTSFGFLLQITVFDS
jgi:hypothetical protein